MEETKGTGEIIALNQSTENHDYSKLSSQQYPIFFDQSFFFSITRLTLNTGHKVKEQLELKILQDSIESITLTKSTEDQDSSISS